MTVAEIDAAGRRGAGGRPTILTIFNQKGGIGKTTTSINLAVCLAAMGSRVVLVDLDSQSNATVGLGIVAPPSRGAYDLIAGTASLAEVRKPTAYPGLFVCGASDELAGADIELAMVDDPQRQLARALTGLGDVDFVVVDCPPALGMLPVNALAACDWAILPVTPEPMARDGLAKAWRHIQRIRANLNRDLEVAGILLTMTSADPLHQKMAETIRAEFGERVLPLAIPYDPKVVESSSHDRPVAVHAPESPAAQAYLELARLVVARAQARAAATRPLAEGDLPDPGAVGIEPARAALRAWGGRGAHPSAAVHGSGPEEGWVPPADLDPTPVAPRVRWRLLGAVALFAIGGLLGLVAGLAWNRF